MIIIQPTDPLANWLEYWTTWWIIWSPRLPLILGLVLFWITLIIIYGLLRRFLRRRVRKTGVPPDAINGLVIALGLVFIYVAIITFFIVIPEVYTYLIVGLGASSLIIGAALGLAIGQAVRNFVSGLYVIFSRPFHVEDYVRIGEKEGIVLEINMNYTTLLQPEGTEIKIPNGTVLDSPVTNFLYDKQDLESEIAETEQMDIERTRVLQRIRGVIEKKKIVRYVFNISFHVNQNLQDLRSALDSTCKEWTTQFGFQPLYDIADVTQFAFIFMFTIFVDNPRKIFQYRSQFIDDILDKIFLNTK
ncbi:MAG: mechanosensitive ion channel domain-containing protein [Promethearchaeota archaeon]